MKHLLFILILSLATTGWGQAPQEERSVEQNSSVAETAARLDRMQTQLQIIEGNIEAQNVLMKQVEDKVERNYRDLEMRIQAMEGKINLFEEALKNGLAKISPQASKEFDAFQNTLSLVQSTEYARALSAFQQFLTQYPKSAHKEEALFWIAECRYSLKDYSQAIKDYQKFVQTYPKSAHAPLAVLKQGDGFLNLSMNNEAKVFFKKLIQDYPNSNEAAQAQGKLAALEKGETPLTAPPPTAPTAPTTIPPASNPAPGETSEF